MLVGEHLHLAGFDGVEVCWATDSGLSLGRLVAGAATSVSMKPACTATSRLPWWWSSMRIPFVKDHACALEAP
jgi:hypothetical protein